MKTVKTASFAALAAILVLSGCGSSNSSNESDATDVNGKVTLNFITQSSPLAPADPNDKLINKRLEEKTGIHIRWKNFTSDQFVEKGIWLLPAAICRMQCSTRATRIMTCSS